jgi:hypothetical protein
MVFAMTKRIMHNANMMEVIAAMPMPTWITVMCATAIIKELVNQVFSLHRLEMVSAIMKPTLKYVAMILVTVVQILT